MNRKSAFAIVALLTMSFFNPALAATACTDKYPVTSITTTGGGQNKSTNESMMVTFSGHITTTSGLTSGGKNTVKICESSSVTYSVTTPPSNTTELNPLLPPLLATNASCINAGTSGTLQPGDKLVCSNKAFGGHDTDRFRIVGVK